MKIEAKANMSILSAKVANLRQKHLVFKLVLCHGLSDVTFNALLSSEVRTVVSSFIYLFSFEKS